MKKNGRISVKNRQALVVPVLKYAHDNTLPANLVMSAVLWAGERNKARMSPRMLTSCINANTIVDYQKELARRAAAYDLQITGMARRLLPKDKRQPETIAALVASVHKCRSSVGRLSVKEIKEILTAEATGVS